MLTDRLASVTIAAALCSATSLRYGVVRVRRSGTTEFVFTTTKGS
jgi:hypothetical protein